MISKKTVTIITAVLFTANLNSIAFAQVVGGKLQNQNYTNSSNEDSKNKLIDFFSVDYERIDKDNTECLEKYTGENIHFLVDASLNNYKFYVDGKLQESDSKKENTFDFKADKEGEYTIKCEAENNESNVVLYREIKVNVSKKDALAPALQDVSVYCTGVRELMATASSTGEYVEYKYQFLEQYSDDNDTSNREKTSSFENITDDFSRNSSCVWNVMKCLDGGQKFTLRVIAHNSHGYDVKDVPFSGEPANHNEIPELKTAINDEIINTIGNKIEGGNFIEFKGKLGYEHYEIYEGNILLSSSNRNVIELPPLVPGIHGLRFVAYNYDASTHREVSFAQSSINLSVTDKNTKSPKINNISIKSDICDNKRNLNCTVDADGENNKYKLEVLDEDSCNNQDIMSYDKEDFISYNKIQDFSLESNFKWSESTLNNIPYGNKTCRKAKVTVENEFGSDYAIVDFSNDTEYNSEDKESPVNYQRVDSVEYPINDSDINIEKFTGDEVCIENDYRGCDDKCTYYVDGEKIDKNNNTVRYTFNEPGKHKISIKSLFYNRQIIVNVMDKKEGSPKISSIDAQYEGDNIVFNTVANGGSDNLYKYEIQKYFGDGSTSLTGPYELLRDYSSDSKFEMDNYKDIKGVKYRIKVTAKNESGFDTFSTVKYIDSNFKPIEQVSINNMTIDSNTNEVTTYLGEDVHFQFYNENNSTFSVCINGKQEFSHGFYNSFDFKPDKEGKYDVLLDINNNYAKKITLNVTKKSTKAPIIKKLTVTNPNDGKNNVKCTVEGDNIDNETDIKYEIFSKFIYNDDCDTGRFVYPVDQYKNVSDFAPNKSAIWYQEPLLDKETGDDNNSKNSTSVRYYLKVTAKNKYGYDLVNTTYSLPEQKDNLEYKIEQKNIVMADDSSIATDTPVNPASTTPDDVKEASTTPDNKEKEHTTKTPENVSDKINGNNENNENSGDGIKDNKDMLPNASSTEQTDKSNDLKEDNKEAKSGDATKALSIIGLLAVSLSSLIIKKRK